jgi:FkbM family methyltransferase
MLTRLEHKFAQVQAWVDSVDSVADWPAAMILAMFRTRPAEGDGIAARIARGLFPHIWIRPRLLHGLWLQIEPADFSQFLIYEEVFITGVYDLDRVDFSPDVVLDCGAYQGYFSLLARSRFHDAPIVAFERNAKNHAALNANINRNHLAIDARAEAVSTSDGTATFTGGGFGGRLGGSPADAVVVKVCDLRRLLTELRVDKLLLKLDIEGEEATLLPALMPVLPARCAIFFEWHQGREEYEQAAKLLEGCGFTTSLTRENRADDGTVYIDAFAQRR